MAELCPFNFKVGAKVVNWLILGRKLAILATFFEIWTSYSKILSPKSKKKPGLDKILGSQFFWGPQSKIRHDINQYFLNSIFISILKVSDKFMEKRTRRRSIYFFHPILTFERTKMTSSARQIKWCKQLSYIFTFQFFGPFFGPHMGSIGLWTQNHPQVVCTCPGQAMAPTYSSTSIFQKFWV